MNRGRRQRRQFDFDLGHGTAGQVDQLVGILDRGQILGAEAVALEPFAVDRPRFGGIALHHDEGRHVPENYAAAAAERVHAHAAELVYAGVAAKNRMVLNRDVASQQHAVGQDGVIADHAVVRDVGSRHDPVVVADARNGLFFQRAAIDRDVLANGVAVADFDPRALVARRGLVLRDFAERTELENLIVTPDRHGSAQHRVRANPGSLANLNLRTDDAVRPNFNAGVYLCLGIYDRRGMDP